MYRIVYVSTAVKPFDRAALLELLGKSRKNNAARDVTGMLLYKDGNFIQLLEGERAAVRSLYAIIKADPRHTGTIVLLEDEAEGRLFADWSMGFRDLSDPEVNSTPGYSQYMNTPLVAESFADDPSGALALLELFKPVL